MDYYSISDTGPLVKLVITLACHAGIRSSSLLGTASPRGLAKSGKAPALGAGNRRFNSSIPDHLSVVDTTLVIYPRHRDSSVSD